VQGELTISLSCPKRRLLTQSCPHATALRHGYYSLAVAKTIVQLGDEQLPKAHVVEMPDTIDTHLNSPACTDIDKSPLPFMGDHYLIEALKTRSVSLEEAEFVMIPYYQVRSPFVLRRP
jgi:hypothetical protein